MGRRSHEKFTRRQILGLVLLAVSSFFILSLFNSFGSFSKAINSFFIGAFGYAFYAIVFGVFASCIFLMLNKRITIVRSLGLKLLIILLILICIFHFVTTQNMTDGGYSQYLKTSYESASTAGGVILSVFLYVPLKYFGYVASVVIFSFLLVIFVILFTVNKMQDLGFFKTLKVGSQGKTKFTKKSADEIIEEKNKLNVFTLKKKKKRTNILKPLFSSKNNETEEDITLSKNYGDTEKENIVFSDDSYSSPKIDEQKIINTISDEDYIPENKYINYDNKDLTEKNTVPYENDYGDVVIDKKQRAKEYLGLVEDKSEKSKKKEEEKDYSQYQNYFSDYRIKQVIKGMTGQYDEPENFAQPPVSDKSDVITKDTNANDYYNAYLKNREAEEELKKSREENYYQSSSYANAYSYNEPSSTQSASSSEGNTYSYSEPSSIQSDSSSENQKTYESYKEYKKRRIYSNEENTEQSEPAEKPKRRDMNEFVVPTKKTVEEKSKREEYVQLPDEVDEDTFNTVSDDNHSGETAEDDLAALLSRNKKFKEVEKNIDYAENIEAQGSSEAYKSVLDDDTLRPSKEERKRALKEFKRKAETSSNSGGGYTMMAASENAVRKTNESSHSHTHNDEDKEDEIKVLYSGEDTPYIAPPVSLLNQSKNSVSEIDFTEKCRIIEQTYGDLGIEVQVKGYKRGPSTAKFEVEKPLNVPISKIKGKEEDLTMRLKAAAMVKLETPIPGTDVFGIEVPLLPNERETVNFRDLIESVEFNTAKGERLFGLGKDINGKENIYDLAKAKHILAAGATGSGKSVFINVLLCSLLYRYSPQQLRLILIDPKRVELNLYNGLPHMLFRDSICDANQAIMSLKWLITEIESRFKLFSKLRVRNLSEYNNMYDKKIPYLLCVVDELNDLMMASKTEVEKAITKIGQIGRAAGIHLVIATQRPSVDVITGLIKANLPSRIAFRVASMFDSKTIFDKGGAEYLLGNGDLLCLMDGENGVEKRLQCPYISTKEVEAITNYITKNNPTSFDEELLKAITEDESSDSDDGGYRSSKGNEYDTAFYDVVEHYITNNKKVSVSSIQRSFGFGYPRAGKIVDTMERLGLIDLPDNTNKSGRDIKWSLEEFQEFWDSKDDEE